MSMKDVQRERTEDLCRRLSSCRMCKGTDLTEYLDLGHTPPADQFRVAEELDLPELSYPLRVMLCNTCGLSQLTHVVDPRVLYQFDYPYQSSTTATGKKHWDAFAVAVTERLSLPKDSLVVDIGSNDGTLLQSFRDVGMDVAGVDPAPNIVEIANERGIPTYCDFFGVDAAKLVKEKHGAASVVVGTNVFAHIDDLHAVLEACGTLLNDDGVFIFESPHFGTLIEHLEYDTIYHEHLSYLSLKPVTAFVEQFGREVFAVEKSAIHGGSFRVYIAKKGQYPVDQSVADLLAEEAEAKLHDLEMLNAFALLVEKNREDLMTLVEKIRSEGKTIALVSTPAKGMTLLNYCGFTKRHVEFATERAPLKIGRFTPGAHIPIYADAQLLEKKPDYALLLAWNFAPEIIKNNTEFTANGGKFIIPIPTPTIQ
ncbi:MAG: putative methyltransferase [Parcubacteria bacterium C7867-007]|nr:MAG: putative methyltransferase [Parcubacteria bacterium C7867-007]